MPYDVVGGAEKQLEYLIKTLKSEHQISVAYMSNHVESWVKSLGVISTQVYSPITLFKKITEFRPDIFQFYHSEMAYRALKKVNPRPKIIEVIHNRHHFSFDATTYPKDITDMCICVSPDAEENFLSRCNSVRTVVIPNGIDTTRFNPSIRKPLGIKTGGYTGRLEGGNGKGIESLIRIMSKLPIKFEFVGQDLAGWKQEIEKHPNLLWYPHTNKPEDYYAKWDFFVSMSPNEGFGLSIAEAIACGIPSIVYNCGGITHYLQHEKHALIAENEDDVVNFIKNIGSFKPDPIDLSDKTMAKSYYAEYADLLGVDIPVENRGKVKTLGVCPASWSGVKHAISRFTDSFCDISKLTRYLKSNTVSAVYFGGFMPDWVPALHMVKKMGSEAIVSIHHMPMLGEFNKINSDSLSIIVKEYKLGNIDKIDTPSLSLSEMLNSFGIKCSYTGNTVDTVPDRVSTLPGINIGIFGSGMPWKNLETQVVAAALYAKKNNDVKIHVQTQISDFCRSLGIEVVTHPHMNREQFLKLAGSMTLNMAVGITETFGYFAVESYLMGVPCLWSATTPSLKHATKDMEVCRVTYIDDPVEIAHHIEGAMKQLQNLSEQGKKFCQQFLRE